MGAAGAARTVPTIARCEARQNGDHPGLTEPVPMAPPGRGWTGVSAHLEWKNRRMRAGGVASVLIAAGVVPPAAAHAGPRVDYKMMFTSSEPGESTGIDVRLLYKRPGHPKAKPVPVREERFTFPAGTTFGYGVVPPCTASDAELMIRGPSACPASWTGAGHGDTIMTGLPGPSETPFQVEGVEDGFDLKLVSRPAGFPIWFVAHAIAHGRVVTVKIPRSPGGPPDGESALRRVHNVFPARSRNGQDHARTPPRCPRSRRWTFRARFTFADGAVEHDTYRMRCRRALTAYGSTTDSE